MFDFIREGAAFAGGAVIGGGLAVWGAGAAFAVMAAIFVHRERGTAAALWLGVGLLAAWSFGLLPSWTWLSDHAAVLILAAIGYVFVGGPLWALARWKLHVETRVGAYVEARERLAERAAAWLAGRRCDRRDGDFGDVPDILLQAALDRKDTSLDAARIRDARGTERDEAAAVFLRGVDWSAFDWGAFLIERRSNWSDLPLSARDNKGRILFWMAWWPVSMAATFLDDPLRRLGLFLYRRLSGLFQKISDDAWSKAQGKRA